MRLVLTGSRDSDQEELDGLTLQLRERLLELDVDDVALDRSGAVPDGAKPVDAVAVGALAVTALPFALRAALDLVRTWIENRPVRTVSITLGEDTLELEAVSTGDQQRLIDAFLAAHAPAPEPDAPAPERDAPAPEPDAAAGQGD
ncbi:MULTISPECIES: hypothetical protein [unclassified Streptomyces]|uniref:hypothetical protein n=1 Tax=unclassified Streptomyces TaxID=2593676 RepID=UPI001940F76B|nr:MULTISPECIES: hypothetical protein [unclassified Streptomyces]